MLTLPLLLPLLLPLPPLLPPLLLLPLLLLLPPLHLLRPVQLLSIQARAIWVRMEYPFSHLTFLLSTWMSTSDWNSCVDESLPKRKCFWRRHWQRYSRWSRNLRMDRLGGRGLWNLPPQTLVDLGGTSPVRI